MIRTLRPHVVTVVSGLVLGVVLAGPTHGQDKKPADPKPVAPKPLQGMLYYRKHIADAVALGGATPESERMVSAGLDWLKRHQEDDGSWSCSNFRRRCKEVNDNPYRCENKGNALYDVGVSALAVLAFLGAGRTDADGPDTDTVQRGLSWLKSQQDARGLIGSTEDQRYMYGHVIATNVMVEAAALNPAGGWRACADKALDYLLKMQAKKQGWRYGEKSQDSDVTVTAWAVMALKTADVAHIRSATSVIGDASNFVKSVTDEKTFHVGYLSKMDGPFRLDEQGERFPKSESESTTACGMVIKILGGEEPRISSLIRAQSKRCLDKPPAWKRDEGVIDIYYWHFATLAMFQLAGEEWMTWRNAIFDAAQRAQVSEGCARGSFDPLDPWTRFGGRIYSTAMMTLTLESGYRYGRLFKTSK